MHIDWSALARVAAVSLGVTVAVVVVFTLGVLGLSRAADRRTGPATTLARARADCASWPAPWWWATAST